MQVQPLNSNAYFPVDPRVGDVGYDLTSPVDITLSPRLVTKVPLGIAIAVPEGHMGEIKDRSSLALKGITTLGGVIDPSYRGEVVVILQNLGDQVYQITAGDRIAQLVLVKVSTPTVEVVDSLESTERGTDGFGSTGK